VIERDLRLLKLSDESEYLRAVVLAAADQSTIDSSLTDSIELYHLAGAIDKVVESVNRALGHSLSQTAPQPLNSDAQNLGLSGAFGGVSDLYGLAQRVHAVYEKDVGKRTRVSKIAWETLGTLLLLKLALSQFAHDRPDLALEVCHSQLFTSRLIYVRPSKQQTCSHWTTTPPRSPASPRPSRPSWTNPQSPRWTTSS